MSTPNLTLEESLYATLVFHDLFSHPLTALEAWTLAYAPGREAFTFETAVDALDGLIEEKMIELHSGMYCLAGRSACISLRLERYAIAESKYAKNRQALWLIARIPFVRMVAICNTLGMQSAGEESDVDIVIVAKAGHLWLVRALSLAVAQVLGVRPLQKGSHKDTLCLSFFLSDSALDVSRFALPEKESLSDPYLSWWTLHFIPIYEERECARHFFEANAWAGFFHPNRIRIETSTRRKVDVSHHAGLIKRLCEIGLLIFRPLPEMVARNMQMRILPKQLSSQANQGTHVVLTDDVIKCHPLPNDRREEFRERMRQGVDRIVPERVSV